MATRTGRASVDVVADVGKFGADLSSGLNTALKKVKVDAKPVSDALTKGVGKGVDGAEKSLMRLDKIPVGKNLAKNIGDGVKAAESAVARLESTPVGDAIVEGAQEAGKALMQLDKIPVGENLAKNVGDGVRAVEAAVSKLEDTPVGDAIVEGAEKAGEALKGLGDTAEEEVKKVGPASEKAGDAIGAGIGQGTEKAKKSLRETGKEGDKAADKIKEGFGKVEEKLAAVGLAAGAALTAGVATGLEKGQLDSLLAAQIGASPAQAERIGKVSGQVYASGFGEDLPQVNEALKAAFQSGLVSVTKSTDATVAQVTKRLLTVGTVLQEDTGRVATAIQQLLRTGLARNADEAMDLLVAATQRGVNKSEDLLDTVNEYGTQFRQLGLNGPQALGLLSQAIQGGARDADTAADALKEFAIRAVDGSTSSAAGFKALGLDAGKFTKVIAKGGDFANEALGIVLDRLREIKDPVKQNAAAVALFGTKAEDLGKALYDMDLDTAEAALGSFGGAAEAAGNTLSQSAGAKLQAFTRQLKIDLTEGLVTAGAHITENKTAYTALGVVLGTLAGTVALVSAATKAWAAIQTAITVATKAWAVANRLLSISILGTPLGWIILLVGALVAAFVLAYTKSETFRNIVDGALRAIGDAAIWLWNNALKPAFNGIVAAAKWVGEAAVWLWQTVLMPTFTAIGTAAMWLWNNAIQPAFRGISAAAQWVASAVSWLWTNIIQPYFTAIGTIALWLWNNVITPAWNGITAATRVLGALFSWWWSVIAPPIKAVASLVFFLWKSVIEIAWAGVKAAFQGFATVVMWWWHNVTEPALKAVGSVVKWLWSNVISPTFASIKAAFIAVGNVAKSLWSNYIAPAYNSIQAATRRLLNSYVLPIFNSIRSTIRDRIASAVSVASSVGSFVSRISAYFTNLINAVHSKLGTVVATVKGLPGRIRGAIGNLGSILYNAGRNVIQGLINGISSKLGALRDKASSAASTIRNLFPFSPAKEGPLSGSGSPEIAGGKIGSMIAAGMDQARPMLRRAAASMAQATMDGSGGGIDFGGRGILSSAMGSNMAGAVRPAPAAGGGGIVFADGAIRVTFTGVVPTQAEAFRTGQAVGTGIASTLTSRDVHSQIRTL